MTAAERLDRLERIVAGIRDVRTESSSELAALRAEVAARNPTPTITLSDTNLADVRAFVGDDGAVNDDVGGSLWLVGRGRSERLRYGDTVERRYDGVHVA